MKVILLVGTDPVTLTQKIRDLINRVIDLLRHSRRQHDLIDLCKLRRMKRIGLQIFRLLRIERDPFRRIKGTGRGSRLARRIGRRPGFQSGDTQTDRGPRRNDDVVFIKSHHIGALRLQNADHGKSHILDPDFRVDGRVAAEKLLHDLCADDADAGTGIDFTGGENTPFRHIPVTDIKIIRRRPDNGVRHPVLVSGDHLRG